MTEPDTSGSLVLVVRRTIRAGSERLFDAWTRATELMSWWGPQSVRCTAAEIDLRVGGRYRIENQRADGARVTIAGEFTLIDRPRRLAYTWTVTPGPSTAAERVTVRFDAKGPDLTEVIVTHERITSPTARASHEDGWIGCLEGLARHAEPTT
jgi:uncharacterized protein YndB with AHSA1/START domain